MSKHTQGPWVFKGTLFGEWHISSEYSVDGKKLPSGRQHVANSPSASSKLNPEYFAMFMANAKLIAAAPDLLEALQAVIDYGSMTGADWVTEQALAAIAKATA